MLSDQAQDRAEATASVFVCVRRSEISIEATRRRRLSFQTFENKTLFIPVSLRISDTFCRCTQELTTRRCEQQQCRLLPLVAYAKRLLYVLLPKFATEQPVSFEIIQYCGRFVGPSMSVEKKLKRVKKAKGI